MLWLATAPAYPEMRADRFDTFPAVTVRHAPWLRIFPHVEAVALPGRILHRDATPRPYLLAHEYAHVRQWARYGTPAMLRQLLREWPVTLTTDARREPRRPGTLEYEAATEAGWLCWQVPDLAPSPVCDEVLMSHSHKGD